ncbi:MAG: RNA methyltransferase [Candidatus Aquicultor secundus]|uniref:RNA methyltransferase n=1 Tax=Candidatus Aquicultor secundus TaxID=1973895 RepID=A0A2M7TBU5_9ACTN|nr:THUMP domain-containing protein [Candidatus Aquicultor secundus]PIW21238.1 MAG: RNA methyltransferase [Candidatus Aquicultor secundus]PIZ42680.1 MAG: RNA methyltransferase [Candidatus Aquicultor secundus]
MSKDRHRFFATAAKGVEPVLAGELRALGMRDVVEETGGVRFFGELEAAYRANLWLRTANRVLMTLREFNCPSEQALYDGVRKIDWRRHLTSKMTLAVDANVRSSTMKHSKYAALKTKDAIVDQLREKTGSRPSVDPENPDLRINVHIDRNHCTLSLDTSDESLHKRGYRTAGLEAPLKETLAAALVCFTEWDMKSPFIDPMCGSGTIVIEAALKAANIAPGLIRKTFGFQQWLNFDKNLWDSLVNQAEGLRKPKPQAPIRGYDISGKAISAAMENARAATVGPFVPFIRKDIKDLEPPPGPGVIIVNPPYGERLGQKQELEPFYKTIGDVFKQKCKGYSGFVFTGNLELAKHIGLKASRRIVLFNGPIESRLLKYELY